MISTPSMGAGAWGWGMAVERAVVTGGAGFVGSSVVEALADSGPVPMNHPGEELVIVLEGRMEFEVDGECHEVEAGDSIHFRAVRPHSWRNPSDEPARAVWLVVRAS